MKHDNKLGLSIIKKHDMMKSSRVNWDSHWEEIAEFIIPNKDNIYRSQVAGEKKNNKIYTSVGIQANEKLASALHGMLTNPSSLWFGLSTGDDELDKIKEVQEWLQGTALKMMNVMNQSNFQTEVHEVYLDLGSFGTALLQIEEDNDMVVRFLSRPIYEAQIEENYKGIVDTVSYEYKTPLRRLEQEFGLDSFSVDLKEMFDKEPDKEICIIHMIEPREQYNPMKMNATNKPVASYHVVKETGDVLKVKGFNEFPYVVPRWSKISGEKYGRSPGMTALSDIKMANAMSQAVIQGAQKVVDPPLQAPDDGVLLPIKTGPGKINYYRAGSKDRIEPLQTGSRPDLGLSVIADVERKIKEAFFVDQLQIREADRMTATEVMQRREEQLRMLSPILGRQHFEFLKPLVERVFSIMARKNLLDPAPAIIQDRELQVQFKSQIARVQQTADTDNLTRVIGLIAPLAQAKPEVMDNFNEDAILTDLANKFGLPAEYLEDVDTVSEIRNARAQAQQQAMQAEQQAQATETIKNAQEFAL